MNDPQLPPQDLRAEQSVIGSIALLPESIDQIPWLRPEHFYLQSHQQIFAVAKQMAESGVPVDPISLSHRLTARGLLADVGGDDYLVELLRSVPHGGLTQHHARIVRDKYIRRQMGYVGSTIAAMQWEEMRPSEELLASAESQLHKLIEQQAGSAPRPTLTDVMLQLSARLESEVPAGISTGFPDLDEITRFRPGEVTVLAARPGVGKTALALCIAAFCCRQGLPVYFVSLEMGPLELLSRLLSGETGIPAEFIINSRLRPDHRSRIADAQAAIANTWRLTIDDRSSSTVATVAAEARLLKRKDSLALLVIDYLQLVTPEDRRVPREQQVATAARAVKCLARDLQVPILLLSQLNRAVEARATRRPQLSDLRESGAIEQDADIVWLLDRPGAHDRDADQDASTVHVAKNRHGRTADVPLFWHGPTMTFRSAARRGA